MNPKVSVAGGILAIIGGFFILLVGAVLSSLIAGFASAFGAGSGSLFGALILGPVYGVIIIILGALGMAAPDLKVAWGALIIIISILSIFSTAIGGLFLGFILALVGGILILSKRAPPPPAAWTPMPPPMSPPMPPPPPSQ